MKKYNLLLSLVLIACTSATISAQSAKRYTLVEHFTQASCGPCAQQNPAFEAFYAQNENRIHHIAYHTSWPGVDPMNAANATEVANRVTYYGVSGVPDMWIGGTVSTSPGSISEGMLVANELAGSPIQVVVTEATNGNQRDVTVKINGINTSPTGNYVLRVAVVEKMVNYATPPGSNGEMAFPNVFRKMLPSTTGDPITMPAMGQNVVKNYSYTLDAAWNAAQIYVIAYIQEETSHAVLNSGTSKDWMVSYISNGASAFQSPANQVTSMSGSLENAMNDIQLLNVTLTSDAPASWIGGINYNGTTLPSNNENITIPASSLATLNVEVNPSNEVALAKYELTVTNQNDPTQVFKKTYYVNNGIRDLVLGNVNDHQDIYTDGLTFANNTVKGALTQYEYLYLKQNNALQGLYNIYYNVGWTFPALSDDIVNVLTPFLDAGGNLLICGQDIAWDVAPGITGNHATAANQAFFSNYLQATYVADGSTSNSQLTSVATDAIYGSVPMANIVDAYNGNMYPDEILPKAGSNAVAIFNYNNNTSKVAGIRVDGLPYKVVYLGIGIEMLSSTVIRKQFVKITHDWFYSNISGVEYQQALNDLLQPNFPNPANTYTNIPIDMQGKTGSLRLTDITGKVVLTQNIEKNATNLTISTAELSAGTYFYHILSEGSISASHKLVVTH